jgi:mRNA interferase MazF
MKDFDSWNIQKKNIHQKTFSGFIHEREIWWCSLGLNIGDEEDGKNEQFERPVLVVRKFNRRVVLIVPLTTKIKDNRYYFTFAHDSTQFAVILSQLRLISTNRMTRRIRKVDIHLFQKIKKAIISVVF